MRCPLAPGSAAGYAHHDHSICEDCGRRELPSQLRHSRPVQWRQPKSCCTLVNEGRYLLTSPRCRRSTRPAASLRSKPSCARGLPCAPGRSLDLPASKKAGVTRTGKEGEEIALGPELGYKKRRVGAPQRQKMRCSSQDDHLESRSLNQEGTRTIARHVPCTYLSPHRFASASKLSPKRAIDAAACDASMLCLCGPGRGGYFCRTMGHFSSCGPWDGTMWLPL